MVLVNFTCQMTDVDMMHRCRGDACGDGNRLVTCVGKPLGEGPLELRGSTTSTPGRTQHPIVKLDNINGGRECLATTRCAMHRATLVPSIHHTPQCPTGEECLI